MVGFAAKCAAFGAEAPAYEAVIDAMISELREYAAEWREELFEAPNHRENWGLVLLA